MTSKSNGGMPDVLEPEVIDTKSFWSEPRILDDRHERLDMLRREWWGFEFKRIICLFAAFGLGFSVPVLYFVTMGPVPRWYPEVMTMLLFPMMLIGTLVGLLGLRYKDLAQEVERRWKEVEQSPTSNLKFPPLKSHPHFLAEEGVSEHLPGNKPFG